MSTVNIDFKADATPVVVAAAKTNAALASIGTAADSANTKIAPAFGNLSAGASKAAAALGPLGGVLSKISPAAGSAASSIAGLASAGQGLAAAGAAAGLSMGTMLAAAAPVAIVVGALAAIYMSYAKGLEETKKQQDALTAGHAVELTYEEKAAEAVRNRLKAEGKWTNAMEAATQAAKEKKKFEEENKEVDDQILALTKKITAARKEGNAVLRESGWDDEEGSLNKLKNLKEVRAASQAAFDETVAENATTAGIKDETIKSDKILEERAKQKGIDAANAAKAATDAADKARALKAAVDAVADAEKELAKITHDAHMSNATELEKEVDSYKSKVARTAELGNIELANAELAGADKTAIVERTTAAQLELAGEHARNVEAIRADDLAAKKKLEEDKLAEEKKAAKESEALAKTDAKAKKESAMAIANFMAEQAEAALTAMADGFEKTQDAANETANQLTNQLIAGDQVYTKAQKAELVKRIAEQRAHAKEAFAIAKAARLAEAVITTAMAVINAYNSGVALPIGGAVLGPAMAIAAGVAGAVSIATIAAEQPSFHSGKSPDEMQATILKKEAVLNTTAAANMGRGRIEDMNNGRMQGSGNGGPAPIVLGHRVFEAGLKRSLDSAGVLREALHAGAVYGHRKNRRISSV